MVRHEEVQNNARLPFYFYRDTDVNISEHWHQGIELNYLIKGEDLRFAIEGHTYHFNSGDFWCVNRARIHSSSGEDGDWDSIGLIIDDDYLLSQYPSSVNWNIDLLGKKTAKNAKAYQELCQSMLKISNLISKQVDDDVRFLIMIELMKIIVLLDQNFNEVKTNKISPNRSLSQDLIDYLNSHFTEEITVQDVVEHFNSSHVTLNQQLKENTKMSISEYLRLLRLMKARELLLSTDKSIEVVAFESGFSNSHVLNRNFKKWKNKTPTQYRNEFAQYFLPHN
ncbi:AraC family transcriptional regulator [uncultured Lactobacillus sp.]|uniref:AraC family transcriptional regulator n=1 Tax=uncultured Lactobacillus sp. TaxID=153152 RepID=UPI002804D356|nr:AraC family transcriptional regulator [uncultured Lactobacillus sp.]